MVANNSETAKQFDRQLYLLLQAMTSLLKCLGLYHIASTKPQTMTTLC